MSENEEIVTTKTIVKSGGCLCLNMTKEIKMLGLNQGDKVLITLERMD